MLEASRSDVQIEAELALYSGQDPSLVQEYVNGLSELEKETAMRIIGENYPEFSSVFWECNAGKSSYPK